MSRLHNNSGKLVWFVLRRERMRIFFWLVCLVFITLVVPGALKSVFGSASMDSMLTMLQNPAMVAMIGPIFGTAPLTLGAQVAGEMILFTIIAVAVMNIFFVIRYTRRDEERGRSEMIRSLPTGRLSTLSSTLTVAVIINLALALLIGFGLAALGMGSDGLTFGGSLLYGFVLGVSGLFFAAVTALFCQLCASSRSAMSYSLLVMAVLYVLRAMGDINGGALAYISPMGLILRTQVYVQNIWWPLLAVLAETVVVALAAFYLNSIRDMDQGFIPARPGKKKASRSLSSSTGLAVRLMRSTFIAWAAVALFLGAAYGSIMGGDSLKQTIDSSAQLKQAVASMSGADLNEQFISLIMLIIALCSAIPAIVMMLKLRGEEKRNRTEHLLARPVSKTRMMADYLGLAVIAGAVTQFAATLGLWAASASVMDNPISFGSMMSTGMAYIPAIMVMVGLAAFLLGWLPELTNVAWYYLGISFFLVYLGHVMQFPDWVIRLSPFGDTPQLPAADAGYTALYVMSVIAVALMAAGFVGYKRRDMQN